MASSFMEALIDFGESLMVDKRIVAAVGALWFYDYFLVLSDEIEYAWSGKSPLIFVLFILNRYWPLWYLLWMFVAFWSPHYTQSICDKTAWLAMFYCACATVFAQVVITLRVYAIARNNRWVASYLFSMTAAQFTFGMYLAVRFALGPAIPASFLPLEVFQFCVYERWRPGEIAYAVLTGVYDTSAFIIVIYSARNRNKMRAQGVPSLLDRIVEDATMYFFIIFISQIFVISFEIFAPASIQLIAASVTVVLMPLMITRLIISLKKAVEDPDQMWSAPSQVESVRFARRTVGGTEYPAGDIPLESISWGPGGGGPSGRSDQL